MGTSELKVVMNWKVIWTEGQKDRRTLSDVSSTLLTHHGLAEVVGVHAGQGSHEEREDVGAALWVTVAGGDEAAGQAGHAAEGGGEGVWLRQRLHGCVGPAGPQASWRTKVSGRWEAAEDESTPTCPGRAGPPGLA